MTILKLEKDIKDKLSYQYEVQRIILRDQKKVLANPSMKINSWSNCKNANIVAILVMIFLTISLVIFNFDYFITIYYVILMIVCGYLLFATYRFKKAVKKLYSKKTDRVISITKEELASEASGLKISIKWEKVAFILISNYSIVLISNDEGVTSIALAKEYKDEFIDALKKEKVEVKIIDNSNSYK